MEGVQNQHQKKQVQKPKVQSQHPHNIHANQENKLLKFKYKVNDYVHFLFYLEELTKYK